MLARLEYQAEVWSRRLGLVGIVGFVAVALVTILDVLVRWLFSTPLDGLEEVNRLIVAVAIASFFPIAISERHHIAITFLGGALGRRSTDWLRLLASAVTTSFFAMVGWQFIQYAIQVYDAGETTWILAWSVTPWWIAVTVIMVLCIPAQIVILVVDAIHAIAGQSPTPEDALPEPVIPGDSEY